MLDLCNILNINVNELLIGEKTSMENNESKTKELLLKMAKQEEIKNKKLMICMWVIIITSTIFYIEIIIIACNFLKKGPLLGTIITASTFIQCAALFYALKIEVDAGYYECKKCNNKHIPNYRSVLWAPNIITTKYLEKEHGQKK